MELLKFESSQDLSIGVELEFQIINPRNFHLINSAKTLIKLAEKSPFKTLIKPEITQSMLEINSSIHHAVDDTFAELMSIRNFLMIQAQQLGINFCGGGTHPFQKWMSRKIFPHPRFEQISRKYKYMAKKSTVFGFHIHIGCDHPEKALRLTHILSRFIPHLIALSASSPFYQGVDTGHHSSRASIFLNLYPLSGVIPFITDWRQFSQYFTKMKELKIVQTMKDFYWDVRPKPEYGTVEIRVCDTPLTFKKAMLILAYVQTLAAYILQDDELRVIPELYMLHNYNRFQGARYGLEGVIINPYTDQRNAIWEDILATLERIRPYGKKLGTQAYLSELHQEVQNKRNDAVLLLETFDETTTLQGIVQKACQLWLDS